MWNYEKRLQYPVKITQTNPKMAQVIISQFGGPDGELAASMRYLSQRSDRNFNRYWHRGTCPHGNDMCHCLPAYQGFISGGN